MGKKEDQLYALIASMQAQIAKMNDPKENPAQNYLTQEALAGSEYLKKGDYSQKPKGMFFDYQMPTEQLNQYKKFANVNQGGTFALGDNAGRGAATATQKNYLTDRFARDASQNYQNNVSNAASNIRGALGSAAGAKGDQDSRIIQAMQGMGSVIGSIPQKQSIWGSVLGAAGTALAGSFHI